MRTNADRAERGRLAFEAVTHDDNDEITNLYDLVCDLLHFADSIADPSEVTPDEEWAGLYVASMAEMHYRAEVREERAERAFDAGLVGELTFRTRDLTGHGDVEEGHGQYIDTGEVDTWGKRQYDDPEGGSSIYLFADEIVEWVPPEKYIGPSFADGE